MRRLAIASAILIALGGCHLEGADAAAADQLESKPASASASAQDHADAPATDRSPTDADTSISATRDAGDGSPTDAWPDTGLDASEATQSDTGSVDALPSDAGSGATTAGFDPARVPESTANLPPLPFFEMPQGTRSVFNDAQRRPSFDERYVIAGSALMRIEGEVYQDKFRLDQPGLDWSKLQFLRNFGNVLQDLGGRKVSTVERIDADMWTAVGDPGRSGKLASFDEAISFHGPRFETWLIRQGGDEYWINLTAWDYGPTGFFTLIKRAGMKQELGTLDADQMRQALDADGRVALYINFDIDKAELRSDAMVTVAEVEKLMRGNPGLSLSVEGHTDDSGNAAHNRDLSRRRAESVVAALVTRGIAPGRLQSTGFGPDRPITSNASDEGRARNRRVELVKRD